MSDQKNDGRLMLLMSNHDRIPKPKHGSTSGLRSSQDSASDQIQYQIYLFILFHLFYNVNNIEHDNASSHEVMNDECQDNV